MADLSLDGRKKVKGLKDDFKKCFGATLRVYTTPACKVPAKDDATLASLRAEGKTGGACSFGGNLRVANFEKKVEELYGIGVQVATPDDKKLAPNDITLAAAGKL